MNLAILTSSYPSAKDDFRGIFVKEMADALVLQGYSATVFAPVSSGRTYDEGSLHRVTTIPSPRSSSAYSGIFGKKGVVENLKWNPLKVIRLAAFFPHCLYGVAHVIEAFDLIISHWLFPIGFIGACLSRQTGKRHRIVVHSHDPVVEKIPFYREITHFIACNCEKFYFVSDFVRRSFISSVAQETARIVMEKSSVVPMGINLKKYSGFDPAARERNGFLFCGRDIKLKGFDLVEKAFSFMPGQRLTAAGITGNRPSVANIDRIGEISPEELATLLKNSLSLIVPSRTIGRRAEGFPRVILEALASGCVVAASRTGGIPEIIEHGVNGFLFQPDSVEEIVKTVRMISQKPAILETIRENGMNTVRKYDWSEVAVHFLTL